MAINQKVGSFQLNNTIGPKSITGLGFQPKAILFFHNPSTTDVGVPQIANQYGMIGFADDTLAQRSIFWFEPNGNSGLEGVLYNQSSYCINCGVNPGAQMWYANLTSMDADGFTINITSAPPDVYRVGYLAIGGSGITGVKVGEFTAGTGTQAVTGVGFQPTGLLAMSLWRNDALKTSGVATGGEYAQTFGMSDGGTSYCTGLDQRSSAISVKLGGKVQAAHFIGSPSRTGANTWRYRANLTSFDADGFTLSWVLASAGFKIFYLAFTGPASKVGFFQAPTTLGTFTPITSLAFQPNAVILASANQTGFGDIQGNGEVANGPGAAYSYGFATDDLEQFNTEACGVDFTTTTYGGFYQSKVASYAKYTYNNRASIEEQIAFDSFGTNSITFNALAVLGSGTSAIPYMAIEGTPPTPPPSDPTGGSGDPDSPDSSFLFNMI